MVIQCSVIFLFMAVGEFIVWLTGIPIPSSILGMILLTLSLQYGLIKESWVDRIADFLVSNLGFFFVPAGVGLMQCMGIIKAQWLPIVMATVVSTILIIAGTGWTHRLTRHLTRRHPHPTPTHKQ